MTMKTYIYSFLFTNQLGRLSVLGGYFFVLMSLASSGGDVGAQFAALPLCGNVGKPLTWSVVHLISLRRQLGGSAPQTPRTL